MKFVSRAAWQARPAHYRTGFTPSFGTTVHYEGPRMGTFPHASCAAKVRGIQAFHMDGRGWADIAYTAVVCPHGYVFEGRWIGARTGANGTNPGNDSAYAVCVMLGQGDEVPAEAYDAVAETTALLRSSGRAGKRVNGHRDWKPTACPGDPLYAAVKAGRFTGTATPTTPDGDLTMSEASDLVKHELAALEDRLMDRLNGIAAGIMLDEASDGKEAKTIGQAIAKASRVAGVAAGYAKAGTLLDTDDAERKYRQDLAAWFDPSTTKPAGAKMPVRPKTPAK